MTEVITFVVHFQRGNTTSNSQPGRTTLLQIEKIVSAEMRGPPYQVKSCGSSE